MSYSAEAELYPVRVKVKGKDIYARAKLMFKETRQQCVPIPMSSEPEDEEDNSEAPVEMEIQPGGQDQGDSQQDGAQVFETPQAGPTKQTSGVQTTSTKGQTSREAIRRMLQTCKRTLQGTMDRSHRGEPEKPKPSVSVDPSELVNVGFIPTPEDSETEEEDREVEFLKLEEDLVELEEEREAEFLKLEETMVGTEKKDYIPGKRERHSAGTTKNRSPDPVELGTLEITPLGSSDVVKEEKSEKEIPRPGMRQYEFLESGRRSFPRRLRNGLPLLSQQLEAPIMSHPPKFPAFIPGTMPHFPTAPRQMLPPILPTQQRVIFEYHHRQINPFLHRPWVTPLQQLQDMARRSYQPEIHGNHSRVHPTVSHGGPFPSSVISPEIWEVRSDFLGKMKGEDDGDRPGTPRPKAPKLENYLNSPTSEDHWCSTDEIEMEATEAQEEVRPGERDPLEVIVESTKEEPGVFPKLDLLPARNQVARLNQGLIIPYGDTLIPHQGTTGQTSEEHRAEHSHSISPPSEPTNSTREETP